MKVILQVLEQNTNGVTSVFFSSAQDQPQGLAHAGRFLTTELPSVTSNIFFINTVLTSKGVNILSKLTEVFYSLSLLALNLADE